MAVRILDEGHPQAPVEEWVWSPQVDRAGFQGEGVGGVDIVGPQRDTRPMARRHRRQPVALGSRAGEGQPETEAAQGQFDLDRIGHGPAEGLLEPEGRVEGGRPFAVSHEEDCLGIEEFHTATVDAWADFLLLAPIEDDFGGSDRTAYPRVMGWLEWAWRGALSVLGLLLVANGVWLLATANLNTGVLLQLVVAVGLVTFGVWRRISRKRWLTVPAILVVAVFGLVSGFLAGYGLSDTASDDEDALIVLGAAVHGREVSPSLAQRLEVAIGYHQRNPEALIVVTGGQGPQEDVAEAIAARDFLLARGVVGDVIVVEDRSTSTEENFAFAKLLLDERLGGDYRVAFVTNEYHVWRAARLAEGAGLDATHLHSATRWYVWPSSYLRESAAVLWTLVA